jgi:hypothetical protein
MRNQWIEFYKTFLRLCSVWVLSTNLALAQKPLKAKQFFAEDSIFEMTLETDLANLMSGRIKNGTQEAKITMPTPAGNTASADIKLSARGNMRRSICYLPPMKLLFKQETATVFSPLKNLKLVTNCKGGPENDQLLLKEYLAYKFYNLLTDLSFRVRLVRANYVDSKGKRKPFSSYAFLIEDVDAMAKRNGYVETNRSMVYTQSTERSQTTLMMLFEYMIANTDFSIPNNHNIKLLLPKTDTGLAPTAVPYDFDYSGFVNAPYAAPDPLFGIESVTERLYRGFLRSQEELAAAIKLFIDQKTAIYGLIANLAPLSDYSRKASVAFLDDFFEVIESERAVKRTFIDGARRE